MGVRRIVALAIAASLAAAPSACRDQPTGEVSVAVIGERPELRDPAGGPLTGPDAILLASVAQGLVRFDSSGNIVPGLAERWNVSDDGLSYIFRIASAEWPDGSRVTAQQVARVLKRQIASRSRNPLKDTLGAVADVVAMTDRVIELRLIAPRPNLLPLLAQPELAIFRNGSGTGPFTLVPPAQGATELRLVHEIRSGDEISRREEVVLTAVPAQSAVRAFVEGNVQLVLGGTFADLPYARLARLPRNSLRFDPASGLFGLVPAARGGPFDELDVRRLLNRAIDRDAWVQAIAVLGLIARATVLEPGLDGLPSPVQPAWFSAPVADQRAELIAEADRLFGGGEKPIIRIWAPEGPGVERLIRRLAADWGALGFKVDRAATERTADLKLVDRVAPSTSAAWFLREFRCASAPICDEEADQLLQAAREAPVPAQRYALLAQAAGRIDDAALFMPIAAPVRWSLVSPRVTGFGGNRYARHPLTDLEQRPGRGGS
jgi:peptide/nickel transport system substrate-binding protein